MSGILLPGQEKQPQSEGSGIELPKGFSSRREPEPTPATPETPPPPAESAPSAPQAPEQAPPRQPRGGQPQVDLMFPPSGAQIQCPNCGTPYQVAVFSIIDLGANPELKSPLLGGQINVASCPSCGAGGPLTVPLLVHDPEHEFLGVFAPPMQQGGDSMQMQKAIGDLTQTLMRKLPTEARKGYLLQPKQFMDWQRLMEQLWEFEGVTPEMLRRQRSQSELVQRLATLANDPSALDLAVERGKDLIDRQFFAMLDRLLMMISQQGQQEGAQALMQLRNQLLESTDAGREVKRIQDKVRAIVGEFTEQTTRDDLLNKILMTWREEEDGDEIVNSLIPAVVPMLDYQFLMLVSERLEAVTDETERGHLEQLRETIVAMQEQQQAAQQQMAQQVQAVLQEVLQATDFKAKLREYREILDESFLSVLAANIQAAQRNNSTAAARRLEQVYEAAVEILREGMPPEMRLLNELVAAPDKASLSQLLSENRDQLTPDFLNAMQAIENELREGGRQEIADRIKSLRGQIALMI